jgi:hypothetical protein
MKWNGDENWYDRGKEPKDSIFYRFDWEAVVCFDVKNKKFIEVFVESLQTKSEQQVAA